MQTDKENLQIFKILHLRKWIRHATCEAVLRKISAEKAHLLIRYLILDDIEENQGILKVQNL